MLHLSGLAGGVALLLSVAQRPAPISLEQQLVALDRRIQQAMVAGDTAFLSRALTHDFRFTHSTGPVQDKADIVGNAARHSYLRRDVLNPVAEVHGKIALVLAGLDVASGPRPTDPATTRGPTCYALNYVHLFVERAGRWQLLSHRTTEMTKRPAPCNGGG
jgi:hypothetical protein